jgi:hypothetical protein
MDEARDPFLSHPALPGNEYRGIDFRHASRQLHHVLHLGALGNDPQRFLHITYRSHQHLTVRPELSLHNLQGLRDPAE